MVSPGGQVAQIAHGPSLAGIFMNIMLYGVMITQTFFYFSTYRGDPKWIKIYVAVLFLADTLNTIFNMWWIYNVLINNFGNVTALETADWLFETEEALAGIIGMQAQLFYAWRIRVLTGNIWLVGAVVLTSLIGGLSGIGTAIAVAMRPQFAGLQRLKVIVTLWLVGAAVCDVIIAAAMIWHLRQKRTGFSRTDHIISRLIHLTMSNGLLTASFALADIIAFLATPRGIHIAFNYTLVKLYGNSVMSSLNSRVILSTSKSKSATSSGHREALGRNGEIGNILTTGQRATQVVVNVETHEMVDVIGTDLKTDVEWNSSDVHSGNSDKNAAVI